MLQNLGLLLNKAIRIVKIVFWVSWLILSMSIIGAIATTKHLLSTLWNQPFQFIKQLAVTLIGLPIISIFMLGANIWWWTWARKRQQHQPLPEIGLICEESYLFLALYLAGKGVALSSLISNDSVQKIMNASQDDKSKELKNFVSLHVLNHYVSINKVAAESFWHFCQAKGPILPHDIKVIMARYMNEALIEENRATIEASGLLKEGIAAGLSMTTAYVSKEKGKVTIYQPSEQELAAWNKTAEQAEASLEKDSHEFVAKLAAGKLGKNTEEKRIYYKLIQDSMRSLKDEPSFPAFLNHTARSEAVKKLSELKDISDETVTNTLKAIN